jgi:hypothetical protein
MTPEEERKFEVKAEKMLKGHRQAPDGRNFMAFRMRFESEEDMENYRKNYDRIFPDAPGAGI